MPPAPGTLPSFAALPPNRMRTPTTQSKGVERGAAIIASPAKTSSTEVVQKKKQKKDARQE